MAHPQLNAPLCCSVTLLFPARQVGYGSSICWKQLHASAKSDDVEKINQNSTVVGGKIN